MAEELDPKTYWYQYFQKSSVESLSHKRSAYSSKKIGSYIHHSVRDLIGNPKGKLILDAGCGDGTMWSGFSKDNHVIGLDFSNRMLTHASQNGLLPVQADLETIPFKPHRFDIIVAAESVTCLPDPPAALSSLLGYLKADGKLILSIINAQSVVRACASKFFAITNKFLPKPVYWDTIKHILTKANYQVDDIIFLYWFPLTVFRKTGDVTSELKLRFANNILLKATKAQSKSREK